MVAVLSIFAATARGGIISVSFDSGFGGVLRDDLNTPLSSGVTTLNGDGFVLQLGYYTLATAGNNFLGEWVPLTGLGSLNTGNITGTSLNFNQTTIGDAVENDGEPPVNDLPAGTFFLTVTFDESDATKNKSFPSLNTPLAVRFYDSSTLTAGVTKYNAFSIDSGFAWLTPADSPNQPNLGITLDDPGVEYESGGANAGKTTLVFVPEPSSLALALVGVVGLATARRRRAA